MWPACLFILVPLYLASIGPAHVLTDFQLNGHLNPARFSNRGQRICQTVYWPICLACERSNLCANTVSWYLDLCRKLSS